MAQAPTTKTIQMSKLVLKPDPPATQKIKVGTICLFAGSPLDFGGNERTMSYERFERLFSKLMSEKHFSVRAKSANLFDDESDGAKPDFLVGATLRPVAINLCDSVNGQKGSLTVAIEWQIYDRAARQVVETVTTEGTGELPKFKQDGLNAMVDQAFTASLTALIDKGVLQQHVGSPTS